jgi:alpha-glucosidase
MQRWFILILLFWLSSCEEKSNSLQLKSPNQRNLVNFEVVEGKLFYSVSRDNKKVIYPSRLGFKLVGGKDLMSGFEIIENSYRSHSKVWNPVWGERSVIRDEYSEMTLKLMNETGRQMDLIFRAFDDGIAFRYFIGENDTSEVIRILEENSEFNLNQDALSWSIPGNFDSYEFLYREMPLSELVDANTPVTFKTNEGIYLSIHEAELVDYSEMTLKRMPDSLLLVSNLAPSPNAWKVLRESSFYTPWRTIQLADDPAGLIESTMILNLNPPHQFDSVNWITPMKYIGVWWEMHLGLSTWSPGPKHGATTKNTMRYIDFAAENGIPAVLIEGWNQGWEYWGDSSAFDFVTPYDDFDLPALVSYANEKGVQLIGHHETGGDVITYEQQLDSAFKLYRDLGIRVVKTGYAGSIRPKGEYHHGQYMVNHYRKVVETAAKYNLMIDAHEPIKSTGEHRTFPNFMTREGARGMEWNAWSDGNPPSHTCILPFTRCLSGPIDYTPGIFDILLQNQAHLRSKWNGDNEHTRIQTTLAKQLALLLILYSPLQMAADLPENYLDHPAFEWIRNVPVSFDQSKVLEAEIGDFITIGRKNGNNWFVAGITAEEAHESSFELDFLDGGVTYQAILYRDSQDAHWQSNPLAYQIDTLQVNANRKFNVYLAPGGGFALQLSPVQ